MKRSDNQMTNESNKKFPFPTRNRKGILLQKSIVLFIMVSCWLNQVQLFPSYFLCDIFPLFASVFHRCTAGYTEEETIVRIEY